MLKSEADKDNEIARKRMYEFIAKLEEDDGLFWEMSDINAMKLFEYAGYTKREDLIKVYANIRSKTRYQEYVERQKKNSILGRLKSSWQSFLGTISRGW